MDTNFTSNSIVENKGGAIYAYSPTESLITVYNSRIIGNNAKEGGFMYSDNIRINISRSYFGGNIGQKGGAISALMNTKIVNITDS